MSSKECKKLVLTEFNNLRNACKSKNIIFVYGKGKRKSEEQRKYEMLEEWLNKLNTYKCIKSKNKSGLKRIYVSERFEGLRRKSEENITTEEGITERLNRSIQAEGIFSYIKSGMRYLRFRHRSMDKIIAEMKLLALAINIRKLSNKIIENKLGFIRYKEAI
ncbi:transposase [Schnuerera sp. xch1]|uniref:transposase n=1 Tax=Schnuerera sp. xch1 TaxID=2874283 RepID=UPI0029584A86|nr:transposase [Schnuerera sp. xch1]